MLKNERFAQKTKEQERIPNPGGYKEISARGGEATKKYLLEGGGATKKYLLQWGEATKKYLLQWGEATKKYLRVGAFFPLQPIKHICII